MRHSNNHRCQSGLIGYCCRLRDNYKSFEEFEVYSDTYGLAERLGYKTAKTAWQRNPWIEGSMNPSDFRKADTRKKKTA